MKEDKPPIHVLWLPTIAVAGIAYVVSMIDLIPGIGPISWIDDLAVIIGLIWFFTSWLPRNSHRIYWFRPRPQAGTQGRDEGGNGQAERGNKTEFDPFETLNLRQGASANEIKHAYRDMLSKYHPDKVTHLGKEFQQMAHDKVIDIKRAYEMLCGKG